jgi:hypothetical protein
MNIKIGLVAIAVMASFNLQAQSVTIDTKATVALSDVDVAAARQMTQERSSIRNRDDVLGLLSTKLTKEIKYEELKSDLAKQKFITKNVPVEIQMQGEAAISAFIETNFNKTDSAKPYKMTAIWQSSDSVMYIPQVQQAETIIDFTVETKRVEPEPTNNEKKLGIDETKALTALGISSDDLNNLTEGKIKDETPETYTKEVILSEFKSTGHIVSGDYRRADIKLTFTIKEGGRSKSVDKKIGNIQPGDSFSIESNGYIVVDVNSQGVIVREKSTGHTYNSAG